MKPLSILAEKALRGPNIWANFPVLEVWVDLGELKDTSSEMMPGFNERLMSWLPTMIEHRCSIGERGGFFERLRRGTYLAHILEHITLEVQSLAGNEVGYGRARETYKEGIYRVVIEFLDETVCRESLAISRELCLAAIYDTPFDVDYHINRLKEIVHDSCLGPSTQSVVTAATMRDIPHIRLNEYNLVQLGYGSKQKRILATETIKTSAVSEAIAQDKELTRILLSEAGVPVPEGHPVENLESAQQAAKDIGAPVVVKPQYGNQGKAVSTNLITAAEIATAYEAALNIDSSILVEKHIEGDDYRLLVVGDKMVAASRRDPAQVIGDGLSTIRELVEKANEDPRRSNGHATSMTHMKINTVVESTLAQQGYTAESIPGKNAIVLIRRNANLSTGGTATDVTKLVHGEVAQRAIEAAKMVGLDVAGVGRGCQRYLSSA